MSSASYPALLRPMDPKLIPKKVSNKNTPNFMARNSEDYGSFSELANRGTTTKLVNRLRLVEKKITDRVKTTSELINAVRRHRSSSGKYVTPSDFHKVLVKLGIYMSQKESNVIFQKFDNDRSGTIDPEEFATWIMSSDFVKEVKTVSRFAKHDAGYTMFEFEKDPKFMKATHNHKNGDHPGTIAWQRKQAKIATLEARKVRMAANEEASKQRVSTSGILLRQKEILENQKGVLRLGTTFSSAQRRLQEALRQSYAGLEKSAVKFTNKNDGFILHTDLYSAINCHTSFSSTDFEMILTTLRRNDMGLIECKSFEEIYDPFKHCHSGYHGNNPPVPKGLATTVKLPIASSTNSRRVATAPAKATRPRYHRIGNFHEFD